jgi:glycosyltransferase involved in cell wall biosynthesis
VAALRLAVDARDLARDYRGIGRYTRAVVRRLCARDDLALTLLVNGPFGFRKRAEIERALDSSNFRVATRVPRDADAVWHPANGTFFASDTPSIVTIHDVAPFRFPSAAAEQRKHEQDPFVRSAQTLTRAIAVSEFGRSEMHAMLGVPLERTTVIYHGVESALCPGQASVPGDELAAGNYLLFIGDAQGEARKNFGLLYEAYRGAWPEGDGPRLAVAGPRPPALPGVAGLSDLTDAQMIGLYRGAIALALPAVYEAFGMPMIEAMACGTPVVASAGSCLPEIGGDAPIYAGPNDAGAWAQALRSVVDDGDLRTRLRSAGLARAAAFDWDRSAERHVAVFRDAAGSPR